MTCHTLQGHALGDKENALRNKYHLPLENNYILLNSSLKIKESLNIYLVKL